MERADQQAGSLSSKLVRLGTPNLSNARMALKRHPRVRISRTGVLPFFHATQLHSKYLRLGLSDDRPEHASLWASGWSLSVAWGINDNRQITGIGVHNTQAPPVAGRELLAS